MNIYFIDTLELTYSSDFDDIIKLTKNFKMVDPKKGAGNKEFISTELSGMGIIIKTRRSSKAELYKNSNKYKLVLRINPNKFYKPYMKTEHISNIIEFCDIIEISLSHHLDMLNWKHIYFYIIDMLYLL